MSLAKGKMNTRYRIDSIQTNKDGIRSFLFSLGCYPGENVTIISKLSSNYIINIKDARYSIDEDLAKAILV